MANGKHAAPTFFVDWQRALMRELLNRIVPAGGGFPAAGELGVAEYMDTVVAGAAELKRPFAEGLAQIRMLGDAEGAAGFAGLSDGQKDDVLRKVESDRPAFFAALVKQAYNGYYSNPEVMERLGPNIRPPVPLGHDVEPGNLDLLENVKKRGRVYRET